MDHHTDEETGDLYISCDALSVGDYGGSGSVGEANIRALRHEPGAWVRRGHYSSRQLWLPDTPENRDTVRFLEEEYPLYDDEEHSRVEMEWEESAFDDWALADLRGELPAHVNDVLDTLEGQQWFALYREAMEAENQYPTMEYSGAHIPVKRIAGAFRAACEELAWLQFCDELKATGIPEFDADDDTDALIAADWLCDHGHEALAEYLRAEVEARQLEAQS